MQEKQNRAANKSGFKGRVFQIALTIAEAAAIRVTSAAILWLVFDVRYSAIARAVGAAIGKHQVAKNSKRVPLESAPERRDQGTPIIVSTHTPRAPANVTSRSAAPIPFSAVPGRIHAQGPETERADRSKVA